MLKHLQAKLLKQVEDALKNPLLKRPIRIDDKGLKSQKYIGKEATVSVNPDTKVLIQPNPTSSELAKRLMKQLEGK